MTNHNQLIKTMHIAAISRDACDRFDQKVERDIKSGCWLWTAYTNPKGYGQFTNQRTHMLAHRLAYFRKNGNIPEGLVIDHLCRNRACVNPDHLEAVTIKENLNRGEHWSLTKTHCINGHSYEPDNLVQGRNYRSCLICHRESSNRNTKAYYQRKLAESTTHIKEGR